MRPRLSRRNRQLIASRGGLEKSVARSRSGSGLRLRPAALDEDQIAAVEEARRAAQQVAAKVLGAQLVAAAHQQRRAAKGEEQRRALPQRGARRASNRPVNREDETARIAEQGGIAELGHSNARIPRRKIERVKECRAAMDRDQRAPGPVRRLSGDRARSRGTAAQASGARTRPPPDPRRPAGPAKARTQGRQFPNSSAGKASRWGLAQLIRCAHSCRAPGT